MPDDLGQVGPQYLIDQQRSRVRLGKTLEAVGTDAHARFYEANYRGRIFHASTAVAGAALPWSTSISATTKDAAIAIYNPPGSGVNAVLSRAYWQYVSGTLGIGSLEWVYFFNASTVPAAGSGAISTTTPVSGMLSSGGSKCTVYNTTTANSSLFAGTPTILRPSGLTFLGTSTAGPSVPLAPMVLDGSDADILVAPGYACGLFAIGSAGTTEKVILGLSWEEQIQ